MPVGDPFPDEAGVQRLARLFDLLATEAERAESRRHGISTELTVKANCLAQALVHGRRVQGWTETQVAALLRVRRDRVRAVELGVIDDPTVVRRYAALLGMEDVLAAWAEAYPDAAMELGLARVQAPAPESLSLFPDPGLAVREDPRVPDWPAPRRVVITPELFDVPTESQLSLLAAETARSDPQATLPW